MQKQFTYKTLLIILLLTTVTSVFSQDGRGLMRERLKESYSLISKNPEKAVRLSMETYESVRFSDDQYLRVLGLSGVGYVHMGIKDYKSAFVYFEEAYSISQSMDTVDLKNQVSVLQSLAIIYSKFHNYDKSIELRSKVLSVAKKFIAEYPEKAKENNVHKLLKDMPYFMAVDYQKKGAHQTAGKILTELWMEAEDKNDIVSYARVLNRLGLIKKQNGEFNEAIEYFGLVVSAKEVSKKRKSLAYHNLGATYMLMGNYTKAESFFSIALGLKEEVGSARSKFITYLDMGELAYKKGNVLEAIYAWEKGLSIFSKVDDDPDLYAVYNWLQLAYMDVDIAKAKAFNSQFVSLVEFHNRNRTIQEAEEASQREVLNALIDREKQKRVDATNRQEFIREFWPVFLGVGLLVLFSLILGYRYHVAVRANKLLREAQLTDAVLSNTSLTEKGQD